MEKRKTAKKVLSLFLTLAMLLSMMSVAAFAEENDGSSVEDAGETNFEEFSSSEENKILDENLDDNSIDPLSNEPAPQADEPQTEAERLQAAAEKGGSYTLAEDVTASIEIPAGVTFSLDLGGYTLTNEDGKHTITNNGTLTITGPGTVDNVSHGKAALYNEGTADVDGCTIARSKEAGVKGSNGGNSYYFIQNNGTMTLTNVTAESTGRYSSMVRNGALDKEGEVVASGMLTIEEGTSLVNGNTAVKNESGTLTVNGGTLTSSANYSVVNYGTAYLKGGDYTGSDGYSLYNYIGNDWPTGTTVISGGKFHADDKAKNADYLAPNVVQNENGEVVARTEDDEDAVAKIGTAVYTSLQAAIDEGGEVTLLKSTTESVTVSSTVTLNIPANVTLTNEDGKHTISVAAGGNLTITGSGTVDNVSHGKAALNNEGTVILNGGVYDRTLEAGHVTNPNGYSTDNGGNSWYTISNAGSMTIHAGVVVQQADGQKSDDYGYKGHHSSLICNLGSLIIDGGDFYGGKINVKNEAGSKLNISGGTFHENLGYSVYNYGNAEISGGIFTSWNNTAIGNAKTMTISGGSFTAVNKDGVGTRATTDNSNAFTTITGGTFGNQYINYNGAENNNKPAFGYKKVKNENNTWTVVLDMDKVVARIDETYYTTLKDAIDAAKTGDTVILLKDITTEEVININTAVTIDLNGTTYTYTNKDYAAFQAFTDLTIQDSAQTKGALVVTDNPSNYAVSIWGGSKTTIAESATVKGAFCVFQASKLTVNGTIDLSDHTKHQFAISGNGDGTHHDTEIVITGTVNAGQRPAIYHPQRGILTIDGGTVSGYAGIGMKSGTLNVINGGEVYGVKDDTDLNDGHSDTGKISVDGSAIVLDTHTSYAGNMVINIVDSTVASTYSYAIREIKDPKADKTNVVSLNVSGNSYVTGVAGCIALKDASVGNITGGYFSADVDEYCADGYVSHEVSTPADYWNVHQQGAGWHFNASEHWQGCNAANCAEGRTNVGSHTYTSSVTTQPTYDAPGVRTYTCTVCSRSYTESIARLTRPSGGGGGGGYRPSGGGGGGTVNIDDPDVPLAGGVELNREDHFAYVSGYEDGTVRPGNNVTREEVAAIFYRLLTETSHTLYDTDANDFSDVDSGRWSNRAISTLVNAGVLSGYPDGTFRPGQSITRAEFAAIAAQFDAVTGDVENPFSDTAGHWAESLISFTASKGWVGGYTDGTFKPQRAITRAEAMTLVNNVLEREVDEEGLLSSAKQWPDNQKGVWYYYEVLEATNSHDYTRRGEGTVENWTAIK